MANAEDALRALLETGRQRGYLTYEEVNAYLPDGPDAGEHIDRLLVLLEENGVELVEAWGEVAEETPPEEPASEQAEAEAAEFVPPVPWPPDVEGAPLPPPLPPAPPAAVEPVDGPAWPPGDLAIHRAFFDAIRDAPEDDVPRLVYADWLDEGGEPAASARAEFIRVQCELSKLGRGDPRRPDLKEREQDLLVEHEREWLGPFLGLLRALGRDWEHNWRGFLRHWQFERGFFTVDIHTPDDLLTLAPVLFEAGLPVLVGISNRSGCLIPGWERWQEFVDSPHLGRIIRLSSFDMDGGGAVVAEAVVTSQHLSSLASLDLCEEYVSARLLQGLAGQERLARLPSLCLKLNRNYLGDEGLCVLAGSPNLCCLTELELGDAQDSSTITAAGMQALAASPHLGRLRRLTLYVTDIGPEGLRALLTSSHLVGLRELHLTHGNKSLRGEGLSGLMDVDGPTRLTSLDLSASGLGDAAVRVLASSPWTASLTTLGLRNNGLDVESAQALAGSPHLRQLTTLDLGNDFNDRHRGVNRLGRAGLEALLNSPSLVRLETLDLSQCGIGGGRLDLRSGDSSAAMSPHLRALYLAGNSLGRDGEASLAASGWLGRLATLDLSGNDLGDAGIESLVASLHLACLRTLRLHGNNLGPRAVWALAASPQMARLTRLGLGADRIGDVGVGLLAGSPYLRNLRALDLPGAGIGPDGAQALAVSPNFSRLRRLTLSGNSIGPDGARALASSRFLTRLSELHLDDNGIGLEGLRALANSPYLTRLTVLSLRRNAIGPRGGEVLQEAPALRRLTRLILEPTDLGENWPEAAAALVRSSPLIRLNTLTLS
jgi:uncharacterized protein (TIGR02996 family)